MHPLTRIQEGFKFGGVVLPKIKISVFGAKMLSSPETPGFEHSGGNSGYRPGNSGFGSPDTSRRCPDTPENVVPDTPGIFPDTPDFWSRI